MRYLYGDTVVESGHALDSALFKPCPAEKPTEKPAGKRKASSARSAEDKAGKRK